MLATQFSRKGCEIFQRNSSVLFQVKSVVRRTLLFQGWNKNPVIKSVPTNHQDNFWVEWKSKQQHFLSTCRRQKRRRLCWWLMSIRSRCPSPPSCFWPSTCRLPRCTRTRRSSSSSRKFLSSTSSTSSMAAQRRFVPPPSAHTHSKHKSLCAVSAVFHRFLSIMEETSYLVLLRLHSGIQNLQREFPEKVPAHQAASVPRLLHQKIHQEQLLRGEEPNNCQLPHHVRAVFTHSTCLWDGWCVLTHNGPWNKATKWLELWSSL